MGVLLRSDTTHVRLEKYTLLVAITIVTIRIVRVTFWGGFWTLLQNSADSLKVRD